MKQISFQELAEAFHNLPVGQLLHFKRYADRDLYGVVRLNTFECDTIMMAYYGGGNSCLFDGSLGYTVEDLLTWIENCLRDCENGTVYLVGQTRFQILLQREWLFYLSDNNDKEPKYANVTIRFKDDESESHAVISLTDYNEENAGQVHHYVNTLDELVELADPDKDATVRDFTIVSFESFSGSI